MSVKLGRNDPCWCGSGKKYKACHAAFDDKLARLAQEGHVVPTHDLIKTPDRIPVPPAESDIPHIRHKMPCP